ncbi:uncharacterized protein LOC130598407 [Pezoporus wallicus]|uniref:uncharacterized protein LOC130598407 n=1 Tax=Pezoporus wallicus TaxID=35540 RepID=UPI002550B184|nr:uncharacterized protein LOC130598407 [Pezoporus wallicus]XP_061314396.1 uncharacterized protein LOC133271906 [Pezoporus flaviventris]XP_061314397.1 uncharacterized protein LOC133271906 [Pezoporus flaviventris]
MEARPPSKPRLAWVEEDEAGPAPSSGLKCNEMRTGSCISTADVSSEEKNSLDTIEASIRSRPKQEDQKLRFLESVCTICTTSSMHSFLWGTLLLFQPELAETLEVLLQEEPVDRLDTTVRQQVMLTIAAMSRAGLLLQEKNSLLKACFCSIFHLPPQGSQGPEAWLYCKTLSAMDSMLQVLVCSASTLGIQELQNIFKLLLPFISSGVAVVQERAVARIARLASYFSTYPLPQFCSCSMRVPELQRQCCKTVVMGRLVGHLTLCCTCKNTGTCHEAAEALFKMYCFTLWHISKRSCVGLGSPGHGQPGATLLGNRKPDPTCPPTAKRAVSPRPHLH